MYMDHIGIATKDPAQTHWFLEVALGLKCSKEENVVSQQTKVSFFSLPASSCRLELLQSLNPNSTIAKFLSTHGSGIHHFALQVADIAKIVTRLQQFKLKFIGPSPGANNTTVVFVHPKSTGGVLIELVEKN